LSDNNVVCFSGLPNIDLQFWDEMMQLNILYTKQSLSTGSIVQGRNLKEETRGSWEAKL